MTPVRAAPVAERPRLASIAQHPGYAGDGWIWHLSNPNRLPAVIAEWRSNSGGQFRPYGDGAMFDLLADPDAPVELTNFGMRGGRHALTDHWLRQRDEGVNHVALNMKTLRLPFAYAVREPAEYVLPVFAQGRSLRSISNRTTLHGRVT